MSLYFVYISCLHNLVGKLNFQIARCNLLKQKYTLYPAGFKSRLRCPMTCRFPPWVVLLEPWVVVFRHELARASFLSNLPLIHPEKKKANNTMPWLISLFPILAGISFKEIFKISMSSPAWENNNFSKLRSYKKNLYIL